MVRKKRARRENSGKHESLTKLLLVVIIAAVVLVLLWSLGMPTLKGSATLKPLCSDGKDNDLDGETDLKDSGCLNKYDNDESSCGDGVCSTTEIAESCVQDCWPLDSCSDSDGGYNTNAKGVVRGYENREYYLKTDYCLDSRALVEHNCARDKVRNVAVVVNCVSASSNFCEDGACVK